MKVAEIVFHCLSTQQLIVHEFWRDRLSEPSWWHIRWLSYKKGKKFFLQQPQISNIWDNESNHQGCICRQCGSVARLDGCPLPKMHNKKNKALCCLQPTKWEMFYFFCNARDAANTAGTHAVNLCRPYWLHRWHIVLEINSSAAGKRQSYVRWSLRGNEAQYLCQLSWVPHMAAPKWEKWFHFTWLCRSTSLSL